VSEDSNYYVLGESVKGKKKFIYGHQFNYLGSKERRRLKIIK
jgi:hypothetical protein